MINELHLQTNHCSYELSSVGINNT